jgi:alpha-mannosidase
MVRLNGFILGLIADGISLAQTMKALDISREPTLYVVPYAHVDTQWRWEFPQTISEYLLKNDAGEFLSG